MKKKKIVCNLRARKWVYGEFKNSKWTASNSLRQSTQVRKETLQPKTLVFNLQVKNPNEESQDKLEELEYNYLSFQTFFRPFPGRLF